MHLDDRLDTPLYQQLFDQLRHRIEEGGQPEGSRLPPIRSMAADLGCARNTVENAYALLAQEGYVKSRPGSGYIVQNVAFLQVDADRSQAPGEKLLGADENRVRYDFAYGNLEPPSPPPRGAPSPMTSCCRWNVPAAMPTTTHSARRPCARPSPGALRPSGASTAPPARSSSRAAPRRACRTCSRSSTAPAMWWPWKTRATTAFAPSSSGLASPWHRAASAQVPTCSVPI